MRPLTDEERRNRPHAVVPPFDDEPLPIPRLPDDGEEAVVLCPDDPLLRQTRKARLARLAIAKLRSMQMPTEEEAEALDQIIRERRPALAVINGVVERWPQGATVLGDVWNSFRVKVPPLLAAVGRIELRQYPVGTGFVVADHVVVTNKHVVEQLFPAGKTLRGAGIRFGLTTAEEETASLRELVEVIIVHEKLDLALLRLARDGDSPAPIALSAKAPATREAVTCIGYPFADYRDPAFANQNFAGNLALETLAPGRILTTGKPGFVEITHDCQTLGGNSGSPLLSLETLAVVAVHYDGKFLERNSAIRISAVTDLLAKAGLC
jgi:S1-C subfamily serine protease